MSDKDPELKVVDRRWWAQQGESAETAGVNASDEPRPGKPTFVEELERQLAEKDRLLQDTLTKYREAAREFDDTRARLRKDVAKDVERGRRVMLVDLLEVVDNLDRAIDAARSATTAETLVNGVEMVRRLFLAKLEGFGVKRIEALHQPFDPARHEAVTTVPIGDPAQDGIVCGVMTQGYVMHDEVLRPALVAVSQHQPAGTRREGS